MDTSKFLKNYHLKQRHKKELQCRLHLGLQQLKEKPYLGLGALLLVAVFLTAWFNRKFFIPTHFLPPNLYDIWETGVSILLIVALTIWELLLFGTPLKSTTEMLLPSLEYIDQIGNRQFQTGEGIAFLQGRELRFIKVPVIRNMEKLKEICIKALST